MKKTEILEFQFLDGLGDFDVPKEVNGSTVVGVKGLTGNKKLLWGLRIIANAMDLCYNTDCIVAVEG